MKTFDQKFVREVAQDTYDQRMRTQHVNIIQQILREAEKGEFTTVFDKDKIPLECIYWLKDKGFEIYTDEGINDNWFEMDSEDFNSLFGAKRIKVVW